MFVRKHLAAASSLAVVAALSLGIGGALADESAIDASQWAQTFPNQYASYMGSVDAAYPVEETGMAGSLADVTGIGNFSAGCLACHSSEQESLLAQYGDDWLTINTVAEGRYGHTGMTDEQIAAAKDALPADALGIDDVRAAATEGITCYSCHGQTPGVLIVANPWTLDAAEKGGFDLSNPDLVCAQCHSLPDYSHILTDPDYSTWFLLQAGTDPDDVYEHFLAEGYANPKFADEALEFDQFYGSVMDQAGADCYDCHTVRATDENGLSYTAHAFLDPGANPQLYENCGSCHEDSAEERMAAVAEVQEDYRERAAEALAAVEALGEAVEQAGADDAADPTAVDEATALYYRALFYYNYGRETAEGVHSIGNGTTSTCFEKAVATAAEGMALLG